MRSILFVVSLVAACGGGSGGGDPDLADRDPRCVSACTDNPPAIDGAGDVCNTGSRVDCLDECEARIAGVPNTCATCLLEDACFNPGGCNDVSVPVFCDQDECTIEGREGSCSFPPGDEAAQEDCERQVNPRREVTCSVDFRPISECETFCD